MLQLQKRMSEGRQFSFCNLNLFFCTLSLSTRKRIIFSSCALKLPEKRIIRKPVVLFVLRTLLFYSQFLFAFFSGFQSAQTRFLKLLTAKLEQQLVSIFWLFFKRSLKARLQFKSKKITGISLLKCFRKVRSSLSNVPEIIKRRQQLSTLRSVWETAPSRSLI